MDDIASSNACSFMKVAKICVNLLASFGSFSSRKQQRNKELGFQIIHCNPFHAIILHLLRISLSPGTSLHVPSDQHVTTQSIYDPPQLIISSRTIFLHACEPPPMIFVSCTVIPHMHKLLPATFESRVVLLHRSELLPTTSDLTFVGKCLTGSVCLSLMASTIVKMA
jgi:hypothetical protein